MKSDSAVATMREIARERPLWAVVPAALVVGAVLALTFDVTMLTTDTAQHISVARNLLAGHGLSTDLAYYEQHHRFGHIPVPQTVWPPLFAILIAGLALLGCEEMRAAFYVALLAFVLVPPTTYVCCRRAGVSKRIALGGALATLAFVPAAAFTVGGLTESLYTLLTMLTLLAVLSASAADGQLRTKPLLLAALFAALAFLTRYNGVTLCAALALWSGLRWLRALNWPAFRATLLVGLPPMLTVAALLWRNYSLTGSTSGGPNVALGSSFLSSAQAFYWSCAKLFGFDTPTPMANVILLALMVVAGFGLWSVFRVTARLRRLPRAVSSAGAGIMVAVLHVILSAALIFSLAVVRYPDFITDRYLAPLWPSIVLVFAWLVAQTATSTGRLPRGIALMAVLTGAVYLVGQAFVAQRELAWYRHDTRMATVAAALAMPMTPGAAGTSRQTLGQRLQQLSSAASPLIETNGQYLGMLLRRPVIGLPEARFTNTVWNDESLRHLARRFGAGYLVFFPTLFVPDSIDNRNRVFFTQLQRSAPPDWLVAVHDTPQVKVYRIVLANQ
jgi:hypothetical protein